MAARCTGCWCTRTLERELPPVAERHGGSSRTAAAAVCQRAGGYGAGLGTLAAAAATLVMARDELLCHGARSSSGTKVFGWHSLGLRLAPAEELRNMDAHSPRRTYMYGCTSRCCFFTEGCYT